MASKSEVIGLELKSIKLQLKIQIHKIKLY